MWQPPLNNKHLYGAPASYISATHQHELAANLLHMKKLQLTDLLQSSSPAPQPLYYNSGEASLTRNTSDVTMPAPTTNVMNRLQQCLRTCTDRPSTSTPSPLQWTTAVSNDSKHLLCPIASSSTSDTITAPMSAFLPPLPAPHLLTEAQSALAATVLDIFPLDVLNGLHFTNPNLAQTITELIAASSALNSSPRNVANFQLNRYFSQNCKKILPTMPRPPPLPLSAPPQPNTILNSPQHLNLFKQYLSMEQQQLHQHLLALNNVNRQRANIGSSSSSRNLSMNGYCDNATMNLNIISASTSNPSTTKCSCSPSTISHCRHHHQLQQKHPRKRRDDLKNLLFKKSNKSPSPQMRVVETEDLLPPPKKKWIRHYLNGLKCPMKVNFQNSAILYSDVKVMKHREKAKRNFSKLCKINGVLQLE